MPIICVRLRARDLTNDSKVTLPNGTLFPSINMVTRFWLTHKLHNTIVLFYGRQLVTPMITCETYTPNTSNKRRLIAAMVLVANVRLFRYAHQFLSSRYMFIVAPPPPPLFPYNDDNNVPSARRIF